MCRRGFGGGGGDSGSGFFWVTSGIFKQLFNSLPLIRSGLKFGIMYKIMFKINTDIHIYFDFYFLCCVTENANS